MLSRKYNKMKRPIEQIRARARVDFEKWNTWRHLLAHDIDGINPILYESKYVRYHMVVSIRYRYLFGGFINSYNAVREIFQIEYLTGFDVSDLIIKLMDHTAMAIGSPVTKMKVKKLRDEGTSLSTNY